MMKIIIAAFLILGFVSAAVASARWKKRMRMNKKKSGLLETFNCSNNPLLHLTNLILWYIILII